MAGKKGIPWRAWTPKEIERVRALAGIKRTGEIARELGRTESAVRAQARARGWSLKVWRE